MSTVHFEPATTVIRWYEDGCSFEQRSPYKAVCTITYIRPDTVVISGMHGQLNKSDMAELFKRLVKEGVTKLIAERRGELVTRDLVDMLRRGRVAVD